MKLPRIKKRKLAPLACILGAVAILTAANLPAIVTASAAARQLPIYCVQRDQKMASLSFDAAWGDVKVR